MPTISGIIFSDNNANGVFDTGDTPLARTLTLAVDQGGVAFMNVTSGADGTYVTPDLLSGTYRLSRQSIPAGYVCTTDGGKGYQTVTLGASNVTGVNIGAAQKAQAAPTPSPTPTPTPAKLAGLGAVAWVSQVAADDAMAQQTVATAAKTGVTAIRVFGPAPFVAGGKISSGDIAQINSLKRLTSRGLKVILVCGVAEGSKALPPLGDAVAYFQSIQAAIGPDLPNWIIEGNNEINLNDYLPLDGQNNTNYAARAAFVVGMLKAAREVMPKAYIISPSCGWGASPQPHIDAMQALVNAGILNVVDAINTHFYFTNANDVQTVLTAFNKMAPGKPVFVTECNANVPLSSYQKTIAPIKSVLAQHHVFPCIYRWCPTGKNGLDPVALTDGKGNINQTVAGAWEGN